MDHHQIKPQLRYYLAKVSQKIAIDQALVYGSYATGTAKKESDVDLLIVSADFAAMDQDQRSTLLYRLSTDLPFDLHVHGATPQEFEQASPLTTLGAVKTSPLVSL